MNCDQCGCDEAILYSFAKGHYCYQCFRVKKGKKMTKTCPYCGEMVEPDKLGRYFCCGFQIKSLEDVDWQ